MGYPQLKITRSTLWTLRIGFLLFGAIVIYGSLKTSAVDHLSIEFDDPPPNNLQVFFDKGLGLGFNQTDSVMAGESIHTGQQTLFQVDIPNAVRQLRFDPGTERGKIVIRKFGWQIDNQICELPISQFASSVEVHHDIGSLQIYNDALEVERIGEDPYFVFLHDLFDRGKCIKHFPISYVFGPILLLIGIMLFFWHPKTLPETENSVVKPSSN